MAMMQKRRTLLQYMMPKDPMAYKRIVEEYGIRQGQGWSRVTPEPESYSPRKSNYDEAMKYRPSVWHSLASKKDENEKVKSKA